MDQNVFRAGVTPGGLTSISQVRKLLCYIISRFEIPVPKEVLISSLTYSGIINYFDCTDSLAELCDEQLLTLGDEGYSATEECNTASEILITEVPIAIRDRAVEVMRQNMLLYYNGKQHNVITEKIDDGFLVHCSLYDPNTLIFSLSLYAPNRSFADKIKRNFIVNGESIIQSIITKMIS